MTEQSPTLRDLIQQALNSGITYRQLEARAVDPDTGATVSRGTLNKIALGKVPTMPSEAHLRAVAAALRAPYESVRQAAIAEWIPADTDRPATPLPPPPFDAARWASYDDTTRQLILDLYRLAEHHDERNHPIEGERARGA